MVAAAALTPSMPEPSKPWLPPAGPPITVSERSSARLPRATFSFAPKTRHRRNSMRTTRRIFLRNSCVALGLPVLQSLMPRASAAAADDRQGIRRLVAICSPLGIHTPLLFPEKAGFDYAPTPYLEPLQEHRD